MNRSQIISDYQDGALSVRQIAEKHGVCPRSVYNCISGHTSRKGLSKQNRRALFLTKEETEALLLCIIEAEYHLPKADRLIIDGIQGRLLNIADELTVL